MAQAAQKGRIYEKEMVGGDTVRHIDFSRSDGLRRYRSGWPYRTYHNIGYTADADPGEYCGE